ncbi:hypothetical protein Zmor_019262 [Zophobas morio]|uniref:Uncharacterized protein n=1 Tax=Zophobas morio TaxID=2755281 RepID=A0AA38HZA6_9CUCU|nr:hypothetical protein Zmor_019262 [Zophobas morio]
MCRQLNILCRDVDHRATDVSRDDSKLLIWILSPGTKIVRLTSIPRFACRGLGTWGDFPCLVPVYVTLRSLFSLLATLCVLFALPASSVSARITAFAKYLLGFSTHCYIEQERGNLWVVQVNLTHAGANLLDTQFIASIVGRDGF